MATNDANEGQGGVPVRKGATTERDSVAAADTKVESEASQTLVDATPASKEEPTATTPELAPGTMLGKYEIRRKLGAGAMGAVYLAFDPMIEREVAVKVLPPEFASRPQALARFLTEARATGKLNHPHVVAIYDIGVQDGLNYIVMEVLRGGNLLDVMGESDVVPWAEACRIIADAADGLAAAHAAGLVHRDIKPENLMLTESRAVKIVDFGLAKLHDVEDESRTAVTRVGQVMGTPQFMSPEQFRGTGVDHRSDIYSLGGTLYQMLSGRFPFENAPTFVQLMYAHLEEPVPDPTEIEASVPAGCGKVICRAMAKAAEDRYQDGAEMARDLRSLVYGSSGEASAPPSKLLAERWRPLESVCVAERSKMQALMLQDFLTKSGVSRVQVHEDASGALQDASAEFDVVVTSMHLPDMSGVELIGALRREDRFEQSMLILNSSDSTIEDLVDAGQTGALALVSKKTKPDQVLRAVHACTYLNASSVAFDRPIDPLAVRALIVTDGDQIPPSMAEIIRGVGLLDVQTTTVMELGSQEGPSGSFDVAILLRTAGDAADDTKLYAAMLPRLSAAENVDVHTSVTVQVDGDQLTLRALSSGGFTAVTRCAFDDARLTRLLQITS